MDRETIKKVLLGVGGNPSGQTQKWVGSPCPFAPWNHDGGVDKTPSFGVKVAEGTSHFNCFTCREHGTVLDMVLKIYQYNKMDPKINMNMQLILPLAEADEEGDGEYTEVDYEELIKTEPPVEVKPFPESFLDGFPKAYTHPYLELRNVPPEVAEALDIRIHVGHQRICFPFRDKFGRLAGVQGRAINPEDELRYFQYGYGMEKIRNGMVWLNEDKIDFDRPLILTEGPFDAASIMRVYDNVAASFTSGLAFQKIKRIRDAEILITMYDVGKGGNVARETIDKHFEGAMHVIPDEKFGDLGASPLYWVQEKLSELGIDT